MTDSQQFSSNIPSHKASLLLSLKGRKIRGITRYSTISVGDAIGEMYRIPNNQVFTRAPGPISIAFDDGLNIGCANDPSLNSVITWVIRNEIGDKGEGAVISREDLYPVDALDTVFSTTVWHTIVGQCIVDVKIIKMKPRNALYERLPNEAGIKIFLSNGSSFILSHGLHDGSDDFSAITEEFVDEELKSLIYSVDL
ncbi:hypothetical protein [Paenibacillus whitsoniae]|uniref:Uncharacterized protein n=1 Tax=Paenibacillus whitsoniae TaxID=2496558 RepID=A0A3S0ARY6_9BACL|nr:hypothetical protein [Paenibacillus whitsoniae]RTE11198.1 hypothetical protein EJQ19_02605 [Paenibacillus whitsoniae]